MTRSFTRRVLIAMAALALLPAVAGGEDALPPRDPQTIAQTVVSLDGQPLRWTVSRLAAGDGATAGDGQPALIVGAAGRIAVDGSSGRAILDPGEGYAIGDGGGARLERTGADGEAWVIGLASADAPDTDAAILRSDPFVPIAGDHELVLVRDVLAPREAAPLPPGVDPVAVLATDGLATIQTPAGESLSLSPGSSVAVDPASTVSAGEGGATVVAAALIPLEAPEPAPATPTAVEPAAAAGIIRLDLYACDPVTTLPRIPPGACERADPGVEFQVFELGSGANRRGMEEASAGDARIEWVGLPDGEYLLNALSLPDGYGRFYVPGLQGINSPPERGYTAGPNEGYILPLGPQQGRSWTLNVYLLPGEPERGPSADVGASAAADIAIRFRECPAGVVAEPVMTGLGCQPVAPPATMVLDLVQAAGDAAFGWSDAEASDALSRTWRGVPAGDWLLTGEMADVFGFAVRSSDPALEIALKPDKSAYEVTLRPTGDGPAFMDIYLLQEP